MHILKAWTPSVLTLILLNRLGLGLSEITFTCNEKGLLSDIFVLENTEIYK